MCYLLISAVQRTKTNNNESLKNDLWYRFKVSREIEFVYEDAAKHNNDNVLYFGVQLIIQEPKDK